MHRGAGLAHGFNVLADNQLAYHWNDDSGSWSFRGGDMIPADDWTFAAVTVDAEKASFYVNGDTGSVNQLAHAPAMWDNNIHLGGDGSDNWIARRMVGALDDVVMYDRALSAGEIRYIAGFRAMDNPGTDNLAAAYTFDADAADSSGNGLDGTLLGDAHVADGVLILDGDDDAVAIPGIGDGIAEFTFVMNVYPTVDQTALQFSGGINTDTWTDGVHFKLNNGNVNVGVEGISDVVGTSIIEPDMWTQIAVTVSPTEVAVYVNGEKEGSTTGDLVPTVNVGAATIGAWNNGGTDIQREMTGMMDDVLIYNRALTEAEVRYLANN
jgi:hypothetical protein